MKKTIPVFIVVTLLVLSVFYIFFSNPSYDLGELTEKFNVCYDEIEFICEKNNLDSRFWVTDESKALNEYYVSLNDKSRIDISFSTNATETQKGMGTFSLSYTISDISEDNNFDAELFTELVNSVSGKTTTADFVTEFLTAPEEKYPVEKYSLSDGDYAVEKMHALNFGEDWIIGYNLTYDNHAELWFYGYIK